MGIVDVCRAEDLRPGAVKIVREGDLAVGVFNAGDELYAIEDRCSHDDGPLAEGDFDPETWTDCPRHGSQFDVPTGQPKTLPAYVPVSTYRAWVEDGWVRLELP